MLASAYLPPATSPCGTAAAPLNAVPLASRADDFHRAVTWLEQLWMELAAQRVYRTDLLGEPVAGTDPFAVTDIQKIVFHLKERGIGVLITDHNVRETLRITDRAYIVHDGVIFRDGTPDVLAADEDVRRIYLGADFRMD